MPFILSFMKGQEPSLSHLKSHKLWVLSIKELSAYTYTLFQSKRLNSLLLHYISFRLSKKLFILHEAIAIKLQWIFLIKCIPVMNYNGIYKMLCKFKLLLTSDVWCNEITWVVVAWLTWFAAYVNFA
jgi:hypothetical protein